MNLIKTNIDELFYNDDDYWEYLFQLAKDVCMEESLQEEDERASSCGAEVHLLDSKPPLGGWGSATDTSTHE